MATDEGQDRTEQPSRRRLEEARREGRLPMGRDATLAGSLAAGAAALAALAPALRAGLARAVTEAAQAGPGAHFALLADLVRGPILAGLAVCGAAAAGGALAAVVQTGGGVWPELALPDPARLWNADRVRLLRRDLWIDVGAATVKVVALAWAAWSAARVDFLTLGAMLTAAPADQMERTFRIAGRIGFRLLFVSLLLAGADLALQRWRFNARMRMTREETRRELKEDEGDPLLRGRRRRRHRDLARGRAAVEVPRADALVVNPTHVAVAIRYRRDEGRAPRVTAKGKGALAEHMRDLARRNAVPIVQDVPLARLLHRKVKVGAEIPASTYRAVAAVLAFVYRLTGRAPAAPSGVRA